MTPPVAADLEAGVPGSGPVMRFLRHAGVAGAGSGAGPVAALLAEFGAWLAGERGLSPVTVRCYRKHARVFLAGLPEPLDGALQRLDSGRVTSFMLGYCRARNTESAKAMVTAIRALLRFLHVSGRTPAFGDGRGRCPEHGLDVGASRADPGEFAPVLAGDHPAAHVPGHLHGQVHDVE